MLLIGASSATAQNIHARQYNIYNGQPKSAVITNPQGTVEVDFDRQGRITCITQGVMKMVYDWDVEPGKVVVSMYKGTEFTEGGEIWVEELSNRCHHYGIGENFDTNVTYKSNGAMDRATVTNPMGSMTLRYIYNSASDLYPYAIEQTMGGQSGTLEVTINSTDSYGNVTDYSQSFMGNVGNTHMDIQYY